MKICKRIITSFVALVTCFSLCATPVLAAWQNELGHWYVNSNFAQWAVGGILSYAGSALGGMAGTIVLPGGGTIEGTALGATAGAAASAGIYDLASYYAAGYTDDDYYTAESDYLSTLDRTTAQTSVSVSGFSSQTVHSRYFTVFRLTDIGYSYPNETLSMLYSLGINSKVAILNGDSSCLLGFFFSEDGILQVGRFKNPSGSYNASQLGVWNLVDLTLEGFGPPDWFSGSYGFNYPVFYSKDFAERYSNFLTSTVMVIYPDKPFSSDSTMNFYYKDSSNTTWSEGYRSFNIWSARYSFDVPGVDASNIVWNTSHIVSQPSGADSSTRTASLMQTINNYNIDNSYTDNSTTVNYFIGSLADDGSVSDVYSPSLYNEETLVFTEPISGTQYQTTGWTYDYNTRTYSLALDSGTMTVAATDITEVICTYGDEAVTIDYCDASGNTVQMDEFAYVMASQSECNINGHTYNVETTKEASCTAAGERTYTCSVCGNQYVEEIPTVGHAYEYSIYQAPTCTSAGIGLYTCSTCGDQYTEQIPALGHDWLPTSITDESWAVPDDVHCPSCSGTTYSYDRSDYEVVLGGKNYFDLSVLSGCTLDRFVFDDADSFVLSFLAGNGFAGSKMRLRELAPYLVVGRTYTLSFDTESSNNFIFLTGFDRTWRSSTSLTMTDEILDSLVAFYGMNSDKGDPATDCRISNIQIELGTEATSYEPYREDEIELIPPIYHFTCDDCSNTWDAEAVYQYAYTTFTCSRCDETMIQSEEPPMEEQDWFLDFGDTITSFGKNALKAIGFGVSKVLGGFVDLIGGIFGFLDETIIGGVKDFFFSLSDSSITDVFRQENSDGSTTIALPDGMASVMSSIAGFFTGLPTEIRGILTFGIVFLFLVAALMLML